MPDALHLACFTFRNGAHFDVQPANKPIDPLKTADCVSLAVIDQLSGHPRLAETWWNGREVYHLARAYVALKTQLIDG